MLLMRVVSAVIVCSGLAECALPEVYCTAVHLSTYAVEYTLLEGQGPCAQLEGEVFGSNTYSRVEDGAPAYGEAEVVLKPELVTDLASEAYERIGFVPENELFNRGRFTSDYSGDDGFCTVDQFTDIELDFPELPEVPDNETTPDPDGLPAVEATSVRYVWNALRIHSDANTQGKQLTGELEFTQDGCTATYSVRGVSPAVPCSTDDDCIPGGNGLTPGFALECNPGFGYCVLTGEPPALE